MVWRIICCRAHDLDNNTQLDGLEIYQAIKHTYESSASRGEDSTETSHEREVNIVGTYRPLHLTTVVTVSDDTISRLQSS